MQSLKQSGLKVVLPMQPCLLQMNSNHLGKWNIHVVDKHDDDVVLTARFAHGARCCPSRVESVGLAFVTSACLLSSLLAS